MLLLQPVEEGQEDGLSVLEVQPLGLRVVLCEGEVLLLMLTLRVVLLQGLEEGL